MKYENFRQIPIDVRIANSILGLLVNFKIHIIYIGRFDSYKQVKESYKDFNYTKYAIVKENDSNIWIETGYYEPKYKPTRYVCWLDGTVRPAISGLQAFNKLQQYSYRAMNAKNYNWEKLDRFWSSDLRKYTCSAGPIVDYNPKYENMDLYDIWEYDLNSAYSSIMLKSIPDVNNPIFGTTLKKGQVGFILDDKCTMLEVPGCYVDIAFNLIKLSNKQKEYIEKLYHNKELAVDELEYNEIKTLLNAGIGYYQKWNPFMRSYIVNKCNNVISDIKDDETVLWNTDAIFSLKRRPELPLGSNIGEFKEIHIKRFAYKGNNYQIDYELPKYRGIPKPWFPEGWNILTDDIPKRCNKYIFENCKLVINKEYYEKVNKETKS